MKIKAIEKYIIGIAVLFAVIFSVSCSKKAKTSNNFTIGFSQRATNDEWRQLMNDEMKRESKLLADFNINLIIKDAQNNRQKQIADIQNLIEQNIDLLIVSPIEAKPLTPIIEAAFLKGIPVIVIDSKIESEQFTSFVGANNSDIGKEAGSYAVSLLNGKGKILEIKGLTGSMPAIERSEGFYEILNQHKDVTITHSFDGQWSSGIAENICDTFLLKNKNIDLIYCHNDFMARGVFNSCKKNGIQPHILGIDGLFIANGGVEMVIDKKIDATFLYPTGGDKAIQLAIDILTGNPYFKYNYLSTVRIDNTNARTLMLQAKQLQDQYSKIDVQQNLIGQMKYMLQRQNVFLALAYSIAVLVIIIGLLISFLLIQKNRINRTLDLKNKTIEEKNSQIIRQRDNLISMIKVAEEANEMKTRFFTSISHEFRTSLSLIYLPLRQVTESINQKSISDKLETVQANADRLLKLSNELLDFDKIDKLKYKLNITCERLDNHLAEILKSFNQPACEKGISLSIECPTGQTANYDKEVFDKVIFNLISNAIKHTKTGGSIVVTASITNQQLHLVVSDTGNGIPPENLTYIFDRFFQAKNNISRDFKGSGIGLALCKELIQLHGGNIYVSSVVGKGSAFEIVINAQQAITNPEKTDNKPEAELAEVDVSQIKSNQQILIVEDNPELLSVLHDMLSKYFIVSTAVNGRDAMVKLSDQNPKLIISDILMPEMDGFELCNAIKRNPGTFHIPVILLTAIESQEASIQGFNSGADAYLTKPFNENVLLSRIINLLESREKLKKFYPNSFFSPEFLQNKEKNASDFIEKCKTIIVENSESEEFGIDAMASFMNTSTSSLYRRIKEITGMKVVDFIKKIKMEYAAQLLLYSNTPVNEISWKVGYADPKYFSKCFQKEFGETPSKFRINAAT